MENGEQVQAKKHEKDNPAIKVGIEEEMGAR